MSKMRLRQAKKFVLFFPSVEKTGQNGISNSKTVVQSFPEEDTAATVKDLSIEFSDLLTEKILGAQWNLEDDTLTMFSKDLEFPRTKRIPSSIADIYDPLGMASPLLLRGRQIHEEMLSGAMCYLLLLVGSGTIGFMRFDQ